MTAFVDTNVLVRHLTGDPPDLAERATAYLGTAPELLLTDLVVAETVYVLESFCAAPRDQVGEAVRSLVAFDSIVCVDPALLLRAVEVYETDRIDFAEAYLVDRGRSRICVPGGELHVPERNASVERGHDERSSKHVRVHCSEPARLPMQRTQRWAVRRSRRSPS